MIKRGIKNFGELSLGVSNKNILRNITKEFDVE